MCHIVEINVVIYVPHTFVKSRVFPKLCPCCGALKSSYTTENKQFFIWNHWNQCWKNGWARKNPSILITTTHNNIFDNGQMSSEGKTFEIPIFSSIKPFFPITTQLNICDFFLLFNFNSIFFSLFQFFFSLGQKYPATTEKVEFKCPTDYGNGNFADPATCRRFYQVSLCVCQRHQIWLCPFLFVGMFLSFIFNTQ